jgi:hypothetical protein
MANGRDKYRSRRNRIRVRKLFWREWDPIGVNRMSGAQDEYDTYADRAYVMLIDEGRSPQEIATYLHGIVTQDMGMTDRPGLFELSQKVAETLVQMRASLEAESNEPF